MRNKPAGGHANHKPQEVADKIIVEVFYQVFCNGIFHKDADLCPQNNSQTPLIPACGKKDVFTTGSWCFHGATCQAT
jgi:hypothetical protein